MPLFKGAKYANQCCQFRRIIQLYELNAVCLFSVLRASACLFKIGKVNSRKIKSRIHDRQQRRANQEKQKLFKFSIFLAS